MTLNLIVTQTSLLDQLWESYNNHPVTKAMVKNLRPKDIEHYNYCMRLGRQGTIAERKQALTRLQVLEAVYNRMDSTGPA